MAKIGYLGHSCFTMDFNNIKLLIDPFITPNPKASHIDLLSIEADFILVTHGHQDHMADLMTLAKQTNAVVISNYEITSWVEKQGHSSILGMNIGGTFVHNELNIKMVNAVHSSSFADGSYAGNPCGFVIWNKEFCLYYSGDTALHMDMNLLGAYHKLDLAILAIGDRFTMGIEDAAKAAYYVDTKRVIGMHYNTFPPININHEEAISHFKKNEMELILMEIGSDKEFNR